MANLTNGFGSSAPRFPNSARWVLLTRDDKVHMIAKAEDGKYYEYTSSKGLTEFADEFESWLSDLKEEENYEPIGSSYVTCKRIK